MKQEDYSRYCQIVGATDVGCKRSANEDYLGQEDTVNGRVAVVCDGMGGHVGGATASHIAVDTILAYLREHYHADPREAITEAIDQANRAILSYAQMHPELTGMGSTCVLLIVREGLVYIGHVGDSRIYLIRNRHISQLTKDHSFVQMLVDAGQITREQAEHHPRKNEITNALGIKEMQPATVRPEAIQPEAGDVFLLCSDGLSGMVGDDDICKTVSRQGELRAAERADSLIEQARQNGGLDNITCQLVEFSVTPKAGTDRRDRALGKVLEQKYVWIGAIAALLLLAIGAASAWWWHKRGSDEGPETQKEPEITQVQAPESPQEGIAPARQKEEHTLQGIKPVKKNSVIYVITFDDSHAYVKNADEQMLASLAMRCVPDSALTVTGPNLALTTGESGEHYIIAARNLDPGDMISFAIANEEKTCQFTASVVAPDNNRKGTREGIPKKPQNQKPQSKSQPGTKPETPQDENKSAEPQKTNSGVDGDKESLPTDDDTQDEPDGVTQIKV